MQWQELNVNNKIKLMELFPNVPEDKIIELVDNFTTTEECIASILDSNNDG